jgi:hypothetical protein
MFGRKMSRQVSPDGTIKEKNMSGDFLGALSIVLAALVGIAAAEGFRSLISDSRKESQRDKF